MLQSVTSKNMRITPKVLARTVLLLILFLASYYLLILRPQLTLPNKLLKAERQLSRHRSTLLQNRLALVELTRLDPDSAGFNLEKSSLVATVQETNKEGLEALTKPTAIPEVDKKLSGRYQELLSETRGIYEEQGEFLKRVFATDSYKEGVEILRSDGAISILTDQTNLILEFEYYLNRLKELRQVLQGSPLE